MAQIGWVPCDTTSHLHHLPFPVISIFGSVNVKTDDELMEERGLRLENAVKALLLFDTGGQVYTHRNPYRSNTEPGVSYS